MAPNLFERAPAKNVPPRDLSEMAQIASEGELEWGIDRIARPKQEVAQKEERKHLPSAAELEETH